MSGVLAIAGESFRGELQGRASGKSFRGQPRKKVGIP
jgi:hypothetical protein